MSNPVRNKLTNLEGPVDPVTGDPRRIDHDNEKAHDQHVPVSNIAIASEENLSFASILKGTAANPLTNFEKKAALINAELDRQGLGKYQICIWFLCGFGYFLDLAWAQGVGIVASAIWQEMSVDDDDTGLIFTLSNAGLAIGALFFGLIVDVIGRRWAFNLTCLITSIFGLLLAAPKYNYGAVCGIYFLSSLGLGGNIPIDATIALEYLPQNRRFLVALLSMWQPIGVTVATAIAYGTAGQPKYRCASDLLGCRDPKLVPGAPCCTVSSNMGWRYEVIILGAMTLFIFFLRFFVFPFHESPKFLISRGRHQEAVDVLHAIAKFNKLPPPVITVEMFHEIDAAESIYSAQPETAKQSTKRVLNGFVQGIKNLKGIFGNKLQLFIFILLAIAYMGDYWSFNLAGGFLPVVLLRNNVDSGQGTVLDTYRQYLIIYGPGIIGAILALGFIQLPLLGRKWSLVISAALQGLSMAMYTQVYTTAGYVGLNAMEYIMQTFFNAVLYASAPELFNTGYRGSASGMLSCLGRLAGIVAPFAGAHYLEGKSSGILWLGAGGIWLSAFVMIFLPVEMRNRQMF